MKKMIRATIVFLTLLLVIVLIPLSSAQFIAQARIGESSFSVLDSLSPTLSVSPSISDIPSPSGVLSPTSSPALHDFPTCPNISASILANYTTGMHAIVGMSSNQPGADEVFDIGRNNATQCFCPQRGTTGIQTNWLATKNISETDKLDLLANGWSLISKGEDWGLSPQEYVAKNFPFICPVKN